MERKQWQFHIPIKTFLISPRPLGASCCLSIANFVISYHFPSSVIIMFTYSTIQWHHNNWPMMYMWGFPATNIQGHDQWNICLEYSGTWERMLAKKPRLFSTPISVLCSHVRVHDLLDTIKTFSSVFYCFIFWSNWISGLSLFNIRWAIFQIYHG